MLQIRANGLTGSLTMGGNVYWDAKGAGLQVGTRSYEAVRHGEAQVGAHGPTHADHG